MKSTWLISPSIDILLVCGGLPWILGSAACVFHEVMLHSLPHGSAFGFSLAFVIASLVIGETHQFTSILRLLQGVTLLRPNLTSICFAGIVLSLLSLATSGITLLTLPCALAVMLFPVVLMQHICIQAKAIGLIYCSLQKYVLSKSELLHLTISFVLLAIVGAVNVAGPLFSEASPVKEFWQGMVTCKAVFGISALVSSMILATRLVQRGVEKNEWLPAPAAMTWVNLVLWILLPVNYVWLFVPVFYHATQHWAIAWFTHKNENPITNNEFIPWLRRVAALVLPVQVLTLLILFLPTLTGGSGTLTAMWSIGVFYIHFLADRVVWRPAKSVTLARAQLKSTSLTA